MAQRAHSQLGTSPAATALEALLRPLEFASVEEEGQERLRDLDATVRRACRRALALALPADLRTAIEKVESAFAGPFPDFSRRQRAVAGALERLAPCREPDWTERALSRSCDALRGVGPRRAELLARRGLGRVVDLLFHLPVRYDDRRSLERIGDLEVGRRATFIGEVDAAGQAGGKGRGGRYRRVFQAVVKDETGSVQLKWFHGGDALEGVLRKGARVMVTGDVRRYRFSRELIHPEVELLEVASEEEAPSAIGDVDLRKVVPEYTTPEGIPPRTLRGWIERAVDEYSDLLPSHLPVAWARERELPEPAEALRRVHAPEAEADVEAYREWVSGAHARLVLEELFLLELGLVMRRSHRAQLPGVPLVAAPEILDAATASLPFALTAAQRRTWLEIRSDLALAHPMNRLLQGDVGSGKTAVAYLAAVAAAAAGRQAALMAPTELLAEQHARTFARLAQGVPKGASLRVALLTASRPRAEQEETRARLARGEVDLVIGTHALVQDDVHFSGLALAIIDEQHRFGVLQRKALAAKGVDGRLPHTLVMTATPIPRTLALSLYGDLDLSIIDELPPGRSEVTTCLLREGEGRRVVELVRQALDRGEQVYVVYPLVEESEKIDLRSATESTERIRQAFSDVAVDLVHGRLEAAERAAAMARFEAGETRILVSTTVIEVGVDVPNATLMVVEHAERFGLAQLHQLRGRVGRGERAGTCALVTRGGSVDSEARLRAMLETTDGFKIADADLQIRGPGEFLGTRQHGHLPDLRVADLLRDGRWLAAARELALKQIEGDPDLRREPLLRRAVEWRWGERLELTRVG